MKKRRRRLRGVVLAVLLAEALLCAVLLRYVFVVRDVRVEGNVSVSDEDVMRIARIDFGSSILRVRAEDVVRRINATGTLCVEELRVRYPDAVEIRVRERERSAMLLHMGEIRILDETGCVVESVDGVPDTDLIYVSGMRVSDFVMGEPMRAADGQMDAYRAVMGALEAQGAGVYVSELDLSDPEELKLITRTGVTVELGGPENMENKVAWMKGAVADLEGRGEGGGTLDVRSGSKADYRRTGAQS